MQKQNLPVDEDINLCEEEEFLVQPPSKAFNKPIQLLIIITCSIFFAETAVMFILLVFPPLSVYKEAFIDSLLLTGILLPVLYFFIYRPFRLHINERKRLEKKLHDISITDHLTGLFNRRGFYTLAQKQWEIARRKKRTFSILFLDLNDMKTINDKFGHRVGDEVLVDSANILKKTFRSSDIIARMGGDEFTVLITEPRSIDDIENIIHKNIQEKLNDYNRQRERGYDLSMSMGISHYKPENPRSIDELLGEADKRMYEQKKNNRIFKTDNFSALSTRSLSG